MKCAVGFCGHCQFGPAFICKDGPVFPYAKLEPGLPYETCDETKAQACCMEIRIL